MKKKPRTMTDWEWITLVGAWRYYEYRNTIVSATFPENIVRRFFASGEYTETTKRRIANQFSMIDHGSRAIHDWDNMPDEDRLPWTKFYCFCWHYTNGWETYRGIKCFYCKVSDRYYPVDKYIANPQYEIWIAKENAK